MDDVWGIDLGVPFRDRLEHIDDVYRLMTLLMEPLKTPLRGDGH
jgi:hypothetical protein